MHPSCLFWQVPSESQWMILTVSLGQSVVLRRTGRTHFSWQHVRLQAVVRRPPPPSEPDRTVSSDTDSNQIHTDRNLI